MKFIYIACSILFFGTIARGQTSPQLSSSGIKAGLQKLGVTGSVLYIAAHPDDENTRLLSYLVGERKVRTGYLSITRGDGGQNLIGTEQAEELGLIRTQELLAARKIDGAEQFFTRANDFGFSKTSEETFKLWNKDLILADVVWVIRNFRPDVIITRFPGDARAGHGHHSASSLLAQEAFSAAADPKRFPEQLSKVKTWKTKRIFWNTFNFGGNNTTSEDQLKINVGQYNALLGMSYGEISSESRSQHKSQGFGVARQRGESYEYFTLLNGEPATRDILEGINLDWQGISNGNEINVLISNLNQNYNIDEPQKSVPGLLRLYSLISALKDENLKARKLKEVSDLILAASGIWFEAYSAEPTYALNDDIPVRVQAISRYTPGARISISFGDKPLHQNISLENNQLKTIESTVKASPLSQPFWLEEKHPIGAYVVKKQENIGNPENPDPLSLTITLQLEGKTIRFQRPVVYKSTDPIRGEIYRNLEVTPPVVANLQNSQLLFSDSQSRPLSIKLKSYTDDAKGELTLVLPKGWKSSPASIPFDMKTKGEEQTVSFSLSPAEDAISGHLNAEIKINNQVWSKSIQSIRYNHIPNITWYPEAEAKLVKLDIKTAGKKLAYINGAGDLIPQSLRQLGYEVTILNENQVLSTDLSSFDAVITGIRLYNIEPRMKYINQVLLKYVENGGIMLVQYNVSQPLSISQIGPYPFSISRSRVTEEDSKVTILNPQHRLFNYPNKITANDFNGWIQERGIYYLTNIDAKYETLLSMNDTGEEPANGSLVVANYGKGRFVYTGLSFFRQLPAAVPGAYRLFVNLISK